MGDTTDELLALAKKVAQDPPRRELDMLLSAGERISMSLLSMALHELGVPAVSFTGSQSGIITNDAHSNARIVEVRPYRVQDELERGKVVIVAGYQGVSYKKEVTTLGRGGSDTTAVALAAALGADCEIYSDVDGVWSGDPRVVPEARKLDALTYPEMQELAEAGAKVLNATAVEFAKEKGIAIWAKSTFGGGEGTVIRRDAPREPGKVVGVASEKEIVLLQGEGAVAGLCELLDSRGVAGKQLAAEGGRFSLVLSLENVHGFEALRPELAARGVVARDDLGAVSCIGAAINARYENLRRALAALDEISAPAAAVHTSSFRISALVAREKLADAVRRWHREFIG
jgi:aspartate kinase